MPRKVQPKRAAWLRLWAWMVEPGSTLGVARRAIRSLGVILKHTDNCIAELQSVGDDTQGPIVVDFTDGKHGTQDQ